MQSTDLDTELEQIDGKLVEQEGIYQRAAEVVQHCEEKRELALLTNPIKKLRQRLQPGEPCQVCGSTDHSFVHIAESEDEDLLQNAEAALARCEKPRLQTAQDQMQALKDETGFKLQQNKRSLLSQSEELMTELEGLIDESESVRKTATKDDLSRW